MAFTELVLTRIDKDFLLLPLAAVERVVPAVAPVRAPSAEPAAPHVRIEGRVLPVWFGASLMGANRVVLEPSDQMLVLRGAAPVVLWVSAVEEVLQAQVSAPPAGSPPLIAGWVSVERRSFPVLDVTHFYNAVSMQDRGNNHVGP